MRYKEWCAIRPRTDRQKRAYMKKIVKQNLVGTSMVILPFFRFSLFYSFSYAFIACACVFEFALRAYFGSKIRCGL